MVSCIKMILGLVDKNKFFKAKKFQVYSKTSNIYRYNEIHFEGDPAFPALRGLSSEMSVIGMSTKEIFLM